jgi:hypothetical protein
MVSRDKLQVFIDAIKSILVRGAAFKLANDLPADRSSTMVGTYVKMPQAPGPWIVQVWIGGNSTDRDNLAICDITKEELAGRVQNDGFHLQLRKQALQERKSFVRSDSRHSPQVVHVGRKQMPDHYSNLDMDEGTDQKWVTYEG